LKFSPAFYRTAAICSFASAITTLCLIFLPRVYGPVSGFEARMALIDDPAYVTRSWAYLVHPFLVVTAALGVAVALRHASSGKMLGGFLGFCVWGYTEALQQAWTVVAFDRTWRSAWPSADEAARAALRNHVAVYDALWDSMYVLLLIAFTLGNFLYGLAMWRGTGLTRVVGWFYFGAVLLTVFILSGDFGGPRLPGVIGDWAYPALQPAARAAIGLWLWRVAQAGRDPVDRSDAVA
jgi:hypothetical protein